MKREIGPGLYLSPPTVVTFHSTGDFAPELCMGFSLYASSDDHAVAFAAESTLLKCGLRLVACSTAVQSSSSQRADSPFSPVLNTLQFLCNEF